LASVSPSTLYSASVLWKIGPLLPNSTIGNAMSVFEIVLAPVLFLEISVDISFSLCAPGALIFVVPDALSNRDVSSVSLMISSSVLKYRTLPAGSPPFSLIIVVCSLTLMKWPLWKITPGDTETP
jgi:hypothetical protein